MERLFKPENAASSKCSTLDTPPTLAIIPRLPEKGGVELSRRAGVPTTEQPRRKSKSRTLWGLRCVTGALFTPPGRQHSVLENSAACVYVETSRPASVCREAQDPSTTNDVGDTLSTSSKRSFAALSACRQWERNQLHGEFDPGSGRTLAARLTHASRARTWASALGTAANG